MIVINIVIFGQQQFKVVWTPGDINVIEITL